ncbi:MAG: polyprenyl synthetase family protein [Planctomycetota bacterium]
MASKLPKIDSEPGASGGTTGGSASTGEVLSPRRLELVAAGLDATLSNCKLVGISSAVEYQIESGGKRLRPALTLWFGELLDVVTETTLPLALAVELLHNVFLVHDDIEDGDEFRRGRQTLWRAYGLPTALNAADYLLAEAYRVQLEAPWPIETRVEIASLFTEVFRTTVEGQARDIVNRASPTFTLAEYAAISARKTGRYLAFGWVGAARLAGRDAKFCQQLWDIGGQLGPAFQIRDDLLDLTAGKARGGEIGCDIREGKPSILYAFALDRATLSSADRERLIAIHGQPRETTDKRDVDWVIQLFHHCGAIEFAAAEARRQAADAVALFERLPGIPPSALPVFGQLAEFIVERKA